MWITTLTYSSCDRSRNKNHRYNIETPSEPSRHVVKITKIFVQVLVSKKDVVSYENRTLDTKGFHCQDPTSLVHENKTYNGYGRVTDLNYVTRTNKILQLRSFLEVKIGLDRDPSSFVLRMSRLKFLHKRTRNTKVGIRVGPKLGPNLSLPQVKGLWREKSQLDVSVKRPSLY